MKLLELDSCPILGVSESIDLAKAAANLKLSYTPKVIKRRHNKHITLLMRVVISMYWNLNMQVLVTFNKSSVRWIQGKWKCPYKSLNQGATLSRGVLAYSQIVRQEDQLPKEKVSRAERKNILQTVNRCKPTHHDFNLTIESDVNKMNPGESRHLMSRSAGPYKCTCGMVSLTHRL